MLRPGAVAEACATTFPWESGPDLAAEALRGLLQLDDEGAAVLDADATWTWRSFGVLERRCVTIRGDVVRPAPTILLPMHHVHAATAGSD